MNRRFNAVVDLIWEERKRQIEKWGEQFHTNPVWMSILMEEVGEACQAILHDMFGGSHAGTWKTEMIHVAAVAIQILEHLVEDE